MLRLRSSHRVLSRLLSVCLQISRLKVEWPAWVTMLWPKPASGTMWRPRSLRPSRLTMLTSLRCSHQSMKDGTSPDDRCCWCCSWCIDKCWLCLFGIFFMELRRGAEQVDGWKSNLVAMERGRKWEVWLGARVYNEKNFSRFMFPPDIYWFFF